MVLELLRWYLLLGNGETAQGPVKASLKYVMKNNFSWISVK